jgi:hypothetical protein
VIKSNILEVNTISPSKSQKQIITGEENQSFISYLKPPTRFNESRNSVMVRKKSEFQDDHSRRKSKYSDLVSSKEETPSMPAQLKNRSFYSNLNSH